MTWNRESDRAQEPAEIEGLDPVLKQALSEFKADVHLWSDSVYAKPRTVRAEVAMRSWRLVAGWSLAAILIVGAISGGAYMHHERTIAAQLAAEHVAEQEKQEAIVRAQKQAQEEEEMLASVDMAVSREVPSAMEPLAQLSDESESR